MRVAVCINHRICYRYEPDAALKSHTAITEMAVQWEAMTRTEKNNLMKQHGTGGFKRHSVCLKWKKFDMATGFCLDVMHQMDEGVSRYFLYLLVDADSPIHLTAPQVTEIDNRWLSIRPPGNENRKMRSIREFKNFKAHELRFFLQYGLPYITQVVKFEPSSFILKVPLNIILFTFSIWY